MSQRNREEINPFASLLNKTAQQTPSKDDASQSQETVDGKENAIRGAEARRVSGTKRTASTSSENLVSSPGRSSRLGASKSASLRVPSSPAPASVRSRSNSAASSTPLRASKPTSTGTGNTSASHSKSKQKAQGQKRKAATAPASASPAPAPAPAPAAGGSASASISKKITGGGTGPPRLSSCRTLDAALRESIGAPSGGPDALSEVERDEDDLTVRRARASLCGVPLDAEEGESRVAEAAAPDAQAPPNPPTRGRESLMLDQALVRQILPPKVCQPLRHGKPVPPEAFSDVTIFFSDVVGFTNISAGVEPLKVVQLLNSLFTVMDFCCSLFPLYKVETIGDAYMVAGGLPERDPDSARHLADFALLVRHAVRSSVVSPLDGQPVEIRMGCHSGDVMAGVVGTMMPRYCLFGDTVNTASRMESTGAPGRVHCSAAFANRITLQGMHELERRGEIAVKGKGNMCTYWLNGTAGGRNPAGELSLADVEARCRELAETSSF